VVQFLCYGLHQLPSLERTINFKPDSKGFRQMPNFWINVLKLLVGIHEHAQFDKPPCRFEVLLVFGFERHFYIFKRRNAR